MLPFIGEVADASKVVRKADKLADGIKAADDFSDSAKILDDVGDGCSNLEKICTSATPKRDELLSQVSNRKLKETINQIYRPNAKIGDGGLADAIRHEIRTAELVGGKSHVTKGVERLKNLENILKREDLSPSEEKLIKELIDNLKNALEGK